MSSSQSQPQMKRTAILFIVIAAAGCGSEQAPLQPPTVTIAIPEVRDVPSYRVFTGTTEAFQSVEIRARVSGNLESILFEPTNPVEAGDVLFVIEKTMYEAAHGEAVAALNSTEADLERAESDLQRIQKAIESEAVSEQELDRAKANRDMAEAAVLGAEARLERARLDLSYTDVRTPISGLVSRNLVDIGNLVGAGQPTLLTTVRNINPVYVYFDVPEIGLLRILGSLRAAGYELMEEHSDYKKSLDPDDENAVPVDVALSTDSGFPHRGYVDFLDNTVNPGTGTVRVRAVVPNDDYIIFPGLFVRVRVSEGTIEDAVAIDETAVSADIGGKFVYVVGDDSIVEQRYVTLGPAHEGMIAILDGLEPTDRYIVNGMLRARPGLPVTPMTEAEAEAAAVATTAPDSTSEGE